MNKLLHVCLLLMILSQPALCAPTTEMPLGIPQPAFGLQPVPANPTPWPSGNAAGYYYINPDSPLATDTAAAGDGTDANGNRYGYPDKPRKTIPASFDAGAFVMLSGRYTSWPQRIQMNGSEAQPIWFVGDPDSPPVFSVREFIATGQYALFDNLRFRDNARFSLRNKDGYYFQHHAGLRNLDMVGTGVAAGSQSAIGISGKSSSERASDIVISNCTISYFGDYTGPTENDFHGIKPSTNVDRVWVLNNTVHHNGGDSIQIGTAPIADENRASHIYVGGNDFYTNFENEVDIKEANHVIVSSNTLHDSGRGSGSIVVHYEPTNIWFINNKIFNCPQGADVTSGSNVSFVGNVFYNVHHDNGSSWNPTSLYGYGTAIHFRGGASGAVVNNTIHDYDTGIQIASVASLELRNNIFHARAEADAYDINLGSTSLRSVVALDHSLFYNPVAGTRVNWATGSGLDVQGVSALGTCAQCLEETTSPLQNASAQQFSLKDGAAAVDAGGDSETYDRFRNAYAMDLATDIAGNARVRGAAIDIGAYEGSDGTVHTYPPSPPTLLP